MNATFKLKSSSLCYYCYSGRNKWTGSDSRGGWYN